MVQTEKTRDRNIEIVMFFYLIFGNRVHAGMPSDEARKEAYDAVELRYNLSKRSLLNIISQTRQVDNSRAVAFRAHAEVLKDFLLNMNEEILSKCDKNNKLIALLEECVNASKI